MPSLNQQLELAIIIQEFDLRVTELMVDDVPLAEAKLKKGDDVLLQAKVENIGGVNYSMETFEAELIIGFYIGYSYFGEVNLTNLSSQTNDQQNIVWVTIPWQVNEVGDISIKVIVDPNDELPDSNRSNNEMTYKKAIESIAISKTEDTEPTLDWVLVLFVLLIILISIGIIISFLYYKITHRLKSKTE